MGLSSGCLLNWQLVKWYSARMSPVHPSFACQIFYHIFQVFHVSSKYEQFTVMLIITFMSQLQPECDAKSDSDFWQVCISYGIEMDQTDFLLTLLKLFANLQDQASHMMMLSLLLEGLLLHNCFLGTPLEMQAMSFPGLPLPSSDLQICSAAAVQHRAASHWHTVCWLGTHQSMHVTICAAGR